MYKAQSHAHFVFQLKESSKYANMPLRGFEKYLPDNL